MKKRAFWLALAAIACAGCNLDDIKDCEDGQTRCVGGDTVNYCIDGNWWGYTQCHRQKCEVANGVAACVPICQPGDTQCDGNVLLECNSQAIWPDKTSGVPCGEQESCMTVQTFAFCANPNDSTQVVTILKEHNIACDENLLLCGDNNNLYSCASDELTVRQECGTQVCGKTDLGVLACINACEDGATHCEGNNLVTCSNHVYGAPVPCAGDTVCMPDKHGVEGCYERKKSFALCSANKCIGNTLYQCHEGIYDNGTQCGDKTCALNANNEYACLETAIDQCTPGCIDGMQVECREDGVEIWTQCPFGCSLDSGKCRPCEDYCDDSGSEAYLYTCRGNALQIQRTCSYGCDAQHKACATAPAAECGNGKLEDGEQCDKNAFVNDKKMCPDWGYPEELVAVSCTDECKIDFSECVCFTRCKNDDVLITCNEDNTQKETKCDYGCRFDDALEVDACVAATVDSDGDGVPNKDDACPHNVIYKDAADADKCANRLKDGVFHVTEVADLATLKAALGKDDHGIHTVVFDNDLDLDKAGTETREDGCYITNPDVVGIVIPKILENGSLKQFVVDGQGHKIESGCFAPDALFASISNADVGNFKFNFRVKGGRGLLADDATCAGVGEAIHIHDIEVMYGHVEYEGEQPNVGGLIGLFGSDLSNETMSSCQFTGSGWKTAAITVNAPNADYVGGVVGYLQGAQVTTDESLSVQSVTGKSYVGGIFGAMSTFARLTPSVGTFLQADAYDVTGNGDYIGGFSGFIAPYQNVQFSVFRVEGGLSSQFVGGYVGYITGSRGNAPTYRRIKASVGSVSGNLYVGGLAGDTGPSFAIRECEITAKSVVGLGYVGGVLGRTINVDFANAYFRTGAPESNRYSDAGAAEFALEGYFNIGGLVGTLVDSRGTVSLHNVANVVDIHTRSDSDTAAGGVLGATVGSDNIRFDLSNFVLLANIRSTDNEYVKKVNQCMIAPSQNDIDDTILKVNGFYWYGGDSATLFHSYHSVSVSGVDTGRFETGITDDQVANLAKLLSEDCSNCEWSQEEFTIFDTADSGCKPKECTTSAVKVPRIKIKDLSWVEE